MPVADCVAVLGGFEVGFAAAVNGLDETGVNIGVCVDNGRGNIDAIVCRDGLIWVCVTAG